MQKVETALVFLPLSHDFLIKTYFVFQELKRRQEELEKRAQELERREAELRNNPQNGKFIKEKSTLIVNFPHRISALKINPVFNGWPISQQNLEFQIDFDTLIQ